MRNKGMLKKMSVKCVTAIMIAAMSMSPVAATLAFPVTVYAEELSDNPNGTEVSIGENNTMNKNEGIVTVNEGELTSNAGTVNDNRNTINTNEESGTVLVNNTNARIVSNEGSVTINKGDIGIGEDKKDNFEYTILSDEGQGNHGHIGTNIGENNQLATIYYNGEDGTINTNGAYGIVAENHGVIEKNLRDGQDGGLVVENHGVIKENFCSVKRNEEEGTVKINRGTIARNLGTVQIITDDILPNGHLACVQENKGTVATNNGVITYNKGSVAENKGTVRENNGYGVVLNLAGGVVGKNYGTVYNYGGTVTDKAKGTEYFSVKITNSNSTSNGSGLTSYNNQDWLGQKGTTISTATITITPESGYKITNVSGFGDNVTATQNSDGTWTLTISSGANTDINVSSELLVDPSKIKIEVEPDDDNQGDPFGQNQDASNPAVTTPAIDTSATALATATWDGATIKIGETTVTVSALAAQDCAGLASTAVTQAELTVVYESIFASTIAANGGSVAEARAEALKIATSLAEYITKDFPTNYTPAEAATYKAAYMDAFLKAIASGKTLKKARNAALSAARTKMAQVLLDQLNNAHTEGVTVGIETPVTPATTQASVVGEAADPVAAQMIAQAQQAMQDAASLANGQ